MTIPSHLTLELLGRLVGFDTTSHRSNLPLVEFVCDWLARHGVPFRVLPDATGQKASIFATVGPPDVRGWVLSGHTDVVPVTDQDWAGDPFVLRLDGDRAIGRGSADMKGFIACVLAAVPALAAARLRRPVHIALSYDEEVGCTGVRPMLAALAGGELGVAPPLGAVIGEPTGMQVVIGHKSKRSLAIRVHGTTAHSSLAPRAVNAALFGARILAWLDETAARLARSGPVDTLYDVPHSTAHVGVFTSGTALNIVPDFAEIRCEFRTIGADDPDRMVAALEAHVRERIEPEMRALDPSARVEIEVYAGFPGLDTPPEAPIVALAKRLAARNDHAKVAFGAEAGLFAAMAGVPAVIVGPGSIAQAHTAEEFVTLAQLSRCEAFLHRLGDAAQSDPSPWPE